MTNGVLDENRMFLLGQPQIVSVEALRAFERLDSTRKLS